MLFLLYLLQRRLGRLDGQLASSVVKIFVGAAMMSVVLVALTALASNLDSSVLAIASGGTGAIVYFATMGALRSKELTLLLRR